MYRFIFLKTGFAESNSVSSLIYQCNYFGYEGYDTQKEAITTLAEDLYAKYYDDCLSTYANRYSAGSCCNKTLSANRRAKYCYECGSPLADETFDKEDFQEYIRNLFKLDYNDYGDAEDTSTQELRWWPFWNKEFIGADRKTVVIIDENCEYVLTDALMEARPALRYGGEDASMEWQELRLK